MSYATPNLLKPAMANLWLFLFVDTCYYKVFLNTLVATSWNAFAGDIPVKSRDAIKLHQEKYNANSVIPHNVLASYYLTDCHQALFFQQDTLVY